nr:hypothetical protein [uncultured Hyphomonas sp.]
MSHLPLGLAGDFPECAGRIFELEAEEGDFVQLAEAYEAITLELQEIEYGIEQASHAYLAQLRRQRDSLRNSLFARLSA